MKCFPLQVPRGGKAAGLEYLPTGCETRLVFRGSREKHLKQGNPSRTPLSWPEFLWELSRLAGQDGLGCTVRKVKIRL